MLVRVLLFKKGKFFQMSESRKIVRFLLFVVPIFNSTAAKDVPFSFTCCKICSERPIDRPLYSYVFSFLPGTGSKLSTTRCLCLYYWTRNPTTVPTVPQIELCSCRCAEKTITSDDSLDSFFGMCFATRTFENWMRYDMIHDVMLCYAMLFDVIWCDVMWCDVMWCEELFD
jgi:hypothetical protein